MGKCGNKSRKSVMNGVDSAVRSARPTSRPTSAAVERPSDRPFNKGLGLTENIVKKQLGIARHRHRHSSAATKSLAYHSCYECSESEK